MMIQTTEGMHDRQGESGNVLFLILIAVALFAALSYAVTQSTRSGGGDASSETNLINSAQLTQYPAGVRTSIVRMIISGTDVSELEFNPPSDFAGCTGSPPTACVFHPSGGGATFTNAPSDVLDTGGNGVWIFNAENEINQLGTTGGTAAEADLIAFLPDITDSICARINQELGLPTTPPAEAGIDFATEKFDGIGVCQGGCGGTIGDTGAAHALNGQPFGCFAQGGVNVYYHVLIER